MFDAAGPQAETIARLAWWFLGVCAVVYALVIAATGWALFRRRQPSDDAPQTHARLGLVIGVATAITVLTLVALTIGSVVAGRGLETPSGPGAVTIDVIGHQWWWEFQYHDVTPNERVTTANELHIPVGIPVVIRAISRDVIHSFWVPSLRGKRDLIPGIVTHTWIHADEPGSYRGQCAEFCGHQHANMALQVVAEPLNDFLLWVQAQRRGAPQPIGDLERRGHDVFMARQCALCHTIRGTAAGARVGPDLTHIASRMTLAAGTLPNTPGHLASWIADPQAVKPGNRMPPRLLSAEEVQAVVAYLGTLK